MKALANILSQQIIQKLGWTLLHFIWQAVAVALLLAILLRVLRKSTANVRYIIACLALGLIVLLPVVTLHLVPISASYPTASVEPAPVPSVLPMEEAKQVPVAEMPVLEGPVQLESVAITPKVSWRQRAVDVLEPLLPYIVSAWFVGVFGLSLWHLGGWAQLQRLRKKMVRQVDASLHSKLSQLAEKLAVIRVVQLTESALVRVPTVVGWLRPVILLPASALTGLSPQQLEAVLAHELAHIKRFDYLVNMLQTVVEILGYYHPAVWWVSHRIRAERENCCDDLAVSISGDRLRYAKALTSMEEIRNARPNLAVAATGGSLFKRISRLLGKDSQPNSRSSWIPSVIAILLIAALAIPTTLALTDSKNQKPDVLGEGEEGWGKPVDGLQVRLLADKTAWRMGETPTFAIDVRNNGQKTFRYLRLMEVHCRVEYDGQWYISADPVWIHGRTRLLKPGIQVNRAIEVKLVSSWHSKKANRPLEVTIGKHTVRVAFIADPREKDGKPVRAVSNPVEIEITSDDKADGVGNNGGNESRKQALEKTGARLTFDGQGNITEIYFGGKATDVDLALVRGLAHLKHLGLSFTTATDAGMRHLKEMPHLESLDLSSQHVTDAGLAHIEALKELKHLQLRGPHFGDASLVLVAKLPRLRRLDLSDWSGDYAAVVPRGKSRYTAAGLASVNKVKTLRVLWLNYVHLGDAEVAQLTAMKDLEELTLIRPQLDVADTDDLRRKLLEVQRTLREALPDTMTHVGGFDFW